VIESHLFATQSALRQMEAFGWVFLGAIIGIVVLAVVFDQIDRHRGD